MGVKMTGAEYKRFVAAPWDEDCDLYMDDTEFKVNGQPFDEESGDFELCIRDEDKIEIVSGTLNRNSDARFREDFVAFARKWQKRQAVASFVVEAEIADVEALKALIKERFPKTKVA